MSNWQPIETAPKDWSVLLYLPDAADGLEIVIAHCASDDPDGDWYPATTDGGAPIDVSASHWMPLPSTPPNGYETPIVDALKEVVDAAVEQINGQLEVRVSPRLNAAILRAGRAISKAGTV